MDEIVYMVGSAAAVTLLVGHIVRFLVLKFRPSAGEGSANRQELDAVCAELREELREIRDEQVMVLEDLTERVEFAERLLARTAQGASQEARATTPV